jgi:Fic family protein
MTKLIKSPLGYSYHLPTNINIDYLFSAEVYNLCIKAVDKLAELRAFSNFAPDVDFFIQMHISKEAVDSNKIEGTETEIDELFLENELFPDEKRNEIEEVKNYIKALNIGSAKLDELPLSTRLIKETHSILMSGVRGRNKQPGEFRHSQNWIGGATIADAHFVPPSHEHISDLMSDLENFLHHNNCPDLIKIGIAHFQFETIHPFLDGNGRIGRLMIILFLLETKLLYKPVLYISEFFEKNRILYYENLDLARSEKGLEKWLKFFLVGIFQTAQKNLETLQKIVELKQCLQNKILKMGKKTSKIKTIVDNLYSKPTTTVAQIAQSLKISTNSANLLVKDLVALEILKEITNNKRNRIFKFYPYLQLFS